MDATNLMTWDDLAAEIAKMSPKERACPVLSQDTNTGDFFGYEGVEPPDLDVPAPYLLTPSNTILDILFDLCFLKADSTGVRGGIQGLAASKNEALALIKAAMEQMPEMKPDEKVTMAL